jgi:phosphoglycerol transferase MdoB-like AlkP superfamily enzyme
MEWIWAALGLLAMAVVMVMSAWVAHICLRRVPDWETLVVNFAFWVVPVASLIAATGQPLRGFGLGTALVFVFQRLHSLKWKYMADTLSVVDLRMVLTPANWLVLRLYPYVAGFAAACLAGLALTWLLLPAMEPLGVASRLIALATATALVALAIRFRNRHEFDPFGFNTHGHFANFLYSASSLRFRPPSVVGDGKIFVARSAQLPSVTLPARTRPRDIVLWLQESTTDPQFFDVPGADLPALAMHQPNAQTVESGIMRVPSWGGSTWLAEFALLTGLSHRDFGAAGQGVYYTVTPHVRFTLPRLLRRHGYRSVVLFPLEKTVYNAEAAYRDLGFAEVLNPFDFPHWQNKSLTSSLVPDQDLFAFALDILTRSGTQPVFLFMLSMAQHGPYDASHAPCAGLERSRLDRATQGRLSDWVCRMQTLSDDTRYFQDALQATGRDLIFSYFGDHQPNIGAPLPIRSSMDAARFLTRYAITTTGSDAAPSRDLPVLDTGFLASLVLEHAGIPGDEFFAANAAMRQLCGGTLHQFQDSDLIQSYRAHIYQDLGAAGRARPRRRARDRHDHPHIAW